MASSPRPGPHLEIQVHPSDIRRGVRYLFLSRRQLRVATASAVVYLAWLAASAALAPRVIGDLLSYHEYGVAAAERSRQGERLQSAVERLGQLQARSQELRLRMGKIHLAYGLAETSIGQGGYPLQPAPPPASIYAATIGHGNVLAARVEEQLQVLDAFLAEVQAFETAHREQVRSTPSTCPLRGRDFVLTSPFGSRRSPFTKAIDFHAGIDLAAPTGTPVHVPGDGVVVFAGRYPLRDSVAWWRYGNLVAVQHGDRFITLYGHCDEVKVRPGQRLEQGDVIATVGSSGWSTSPHLHYEVRRRGEETGYQPVDPRIYILDHRWRDEERLLVRGRSAPDAADFEPLPRLIGRS